MSDMVRLGSQPRMDLSWFINMLVDYSGVSLITGSAVDFEVDMDACLTGGGGVSNCEFYRYQFPDYLLAMNMHIASLECWNVLIAIRTWIGSWKGKHVKLYCDNMPTVIALETGVSRDPLLRASSRELWYLCARNDVRITVRHKAGVENTVADFLSRAHTAEKYYNQYCSYKNQTEKMEIVLLSKLPRTDVYL